VEGWIPGRICCHSRYLASSAAAFLAAVHLGERWIVYCPQCQVEYVDGFTECSDCRVPLLAGTPPKEPADRFDPTLDLVVVLETNDGIQLAMAKGLLEDAGIPFFILGQIATLVQEVDGFLRKWVRVQVPRDREAEARELLEELRQAVTSPRSFSLATRPISTRRKSGEYVSQVAAIGPLGLEYLSAKDDPRNSNL
jgi:hypothetical protein